MTSSPQYVRPILEPPIRWIVCALAWLAFSVAGYLSWHALDHGAVAGCGGGGLLDCDEVLNSGWSRWFGMPIAFAGLICYASIATLCLVLEMGSAEARRWMGTLLVLLATVVAGASLWYVLLQVVAIKHFCPYCLVVDTCGIIIGGLVLWAAMDRSRSKRSVKSSATGMKALQSTFGTPTAVARTAPAAGVIAATPRDDGVPLLGMAMGGAGALLATLIGVQIIFPSKTFAVKTVALSESINMVGTTDDSAADSPDTSISAQTHVAMRVPSEPDTTTDPPVTDPNDSSATTGDDALKSSTPSTSAAAPAEQPRKERKVTFLGGKLTLDVYQHPLLGSPDAPHVIAEIVSYDCPHCRKMSKVMQEGRERYGDQLAIIVMVLPLEKECNHLVDAGSSHRGACATARMALGVASLKPAAFPDFHEWLMKDEKDREGPPSLSKIVTKAYNLADRGRMGKLTRSDAMSNQIKQYVDLYDTLSKQHAGETKAFGLPVQILGDQVMSGAAEDKEDVYRAWEENTGMKPKG